MKPQPSPEALRAIARMMRQPLYQTDMMGVEALVLDNAADEIEILREERDDLRRDVTDLIARVNILNHRTKRMGDDNERE